MPEFNNRDNKDLMNNKFLITRYLEATNSTFSNQADLALKLHRLFKIDVPQILQVLALIRKENPNLTQNYCKKMYDRPRERRVPDRFGFRRLKKRYYCGRDGKDIFQLQRCQRCQKSAYEKSTRTKGYKANRWR